MNLEIENWGLYLITEEILSAGRSSLEVVKEAAAAGVDAVQLREKSLSLRERLSLGKALKKITLKYDIPLIINDRVDLVLALDADGVHLGQDDLPLKEARQILGPDKIIGITAIRDAELKEAEVNGADYLGIGSVFKSSSKTVGSHKEGIGLKGIKSVRAKTKLPITAIGGIKIDNAAEVIKAGADSAAVISALTEADNIREAVKRLKKAVERAEEVG